MHMLRPITEKVHSGNGPVSLVVTYLPTYESQKTGHPATLGLVYAVPNLGTLRMVRVCILPSIMEGFKGLKFFTIS